MRECQLPVQQLSRGDHTDQRLVDARQRCRLPLPVERHAGACVWVTTTVGRTTTCPRLRRGRGPQPDEHNLFIGVAIERAFSDQQRTMASFEAGTSVFSETVPTDLLQGGDRLRFVFSRRRGASDGEELAAPGILRSRKPVQPGLRRAGVRGLGVRVRDRVLQRPRGHHGDRWRIRRARAWLALAGPSVHHVRRPARAFDTPCHGTGRSRAQYFRYSYDFTNSPGVPFLIGVPERFARHSLRGGVSVFLPISSR